MEGRASTLTDNTTQGGSSGTQLHQQPKHSQPSACLLNSPLLTIFPFPTICLPTELLTISFRYGRMEVTVAMKEMKHFTNGCSLQQNNICPHSPLDTRHALCISTTPHRVTKELKLIKPNLPSGRPLSRASTNTHRHLAVSHYIYVLD